MGTALSLFALADEYKEIADQLAEMDVDEQTLADTLEGAAFPVEQKAKAIAAVIGNGNPITPAMMKWVPSTPPSVLSATLSPLAAR